MKLFFDNETARYALPIHSLMKMNKKKNAKKKNKGARRVKIPGGGTVIYAHITFPKHGKLESRPLSNAEIRKLAQGPIAAIQPMLKQALAKQDLITDD